MAMRIAVRRGGTKRIDRGGWFDDVNYVSLVLACAVVFIQNGFRFSSSQDAHFKRNNCRRCFLFFSFSFYWLDLDEETGKIMWVERREMKKR